MLMDEMNPFEAWCRTVGHEILFLAFKRAAFRAGRDGTVEEFAALCQRWEAIERPLLTEAME